jgi:hypothetical protein
MLRMIDLSSHDRWTFSHGFSMPVDFCVWVLDRDGLRVPPFDCHPDGDGVLRAGSLNADGWRGWVEEVVHLQETVTNTLRQVAGAPRVLPAALHPPGAWNGAPGIRDVLDRLWHHYLPLSNARRAFEYAADPRQFRDGMKNLWRDLAPYHHTLQPLRLHMVAYAPTVEYLVPPAAAILGGGADLLDPANFRAAVFHAAEGLLALQ